MDRSEISWKHLLVGVAGIVIIVAPGVLYGIAGETGLQAASIVTTGLLTLALVTLYFQQYTVLNRQTELMERDFESAVARVGQITAEEDYIYIDLKNSGRGIVQQFYLRSEIVSDTGALEIEPGFSQLTAVEGRDDSLSSFSPPKEFKAKVKLTQTNEKGDKRAYPFRFFANRLAHEGIDECTIRLVLEIIDEGTQTEEDVEEFEIAEQEVVIPETEKQELPSEDGESKPLVTAPKTHLEDAIKLKQPQDILPHDFEERISR